MPPIQQLNHPPHPFWDFVQEMNEHPIWGGSRSQTQANAQQLRAGPSGTQAPEASHEQPNQAEDPPEVDPATLTGEPCPRHGHGRGRRGREGPHGRGRHGGPRRGGWPFGPFGGPGFGMPDGFPDAHGPSPPAPNAAPPTDGPHTSHPGRGGPFQHPFHPHAHHPHHHHHGPRGRHSPPPPPFNLGQFLNDLGERIGVDLQGAATGLGIDRFMPSSVSPDVDFEPKADIFDRAYDFTIHVSLPGAKKEDVGVDWDGEHSLLRITGVVHRPDADEEMLKQLVVDGRKREIGVFEKAIRLGTRRDPATIDIAGIRARMADGVLVVKVPKVEKQHERRDVPISGANYSPPRYGAFNPTVLEDEVMFDAAEPEYVLKEDMHPVLEPVVIRSPPAASEQRQQESSIPVSRSPTIAAETPKPASQTPPPPPTKESGKSKEVTFEVEEQNTTLPSPVSTLVPESNPPTATSSRVQNRVFPAHTNEQPQQPPPPPQQQQQHHHHDESDWENFVSEDEGEFVKINVD